MVADQVREACYAKIAVELLFEYRYANRVKGCVRLGSTVDDDRAGCDNRAIEGRRTVNGDACVEGLKCCPGVRVSKVDTEHIADDLQCCIRIDVQVTKSVLNEAV